MSEFCNPLLSHPRVAEVQFLQVREALQVDESCICYVWPTDTKRRQVWQAL